MAGGLGDLIKQVVAAFSGSGSGGGSNNSKQQVIDYLTDKGYSNEAVAAITANIEVETIGSFDHTQKEIDYYDKNNSPVYKEDSGYGLFQFDGSVKKRYNDYLNEFNKEDSTESQIDFMDSYTKGDIKYWNEEDEKMVPSLGYGNVNKLKDIFANEKDPSKIAESFNSIFEKGELETEYGNRKNIAINIYKDL